MSNPVLCVHVDANVSMALRPFWMGLEHLNRSRMPQRFKKSAALDHHYYINVWTSHVFFHVCSTVTFKKDGRVQIY